jgi:hypothetical protein
MAARFSSVLCVGALFAGSAALSTAVAAPGPLPANLPDTAEAAAKTQPVNPHWATVYKPKSKRDFQGIWKNTGGITWVPNQKPGVVTPAPLTPEYDKLFKSFIAAAAAGKPTGDVTATCLPPGMPRVMTMTYPMEIVQTDKQVNIFAEWLEQTRRVWLDGRPLDPDPDPTFYGQTVGHWEGDVLVATTTGLRGDTNLEASGLPHSDALIVYERMWLEDDNTLKDEITLVDRKAYTRPWTVTKTYARAEPDFKLMPYVCLENNRNPVLPDGSTGFVLQGENKK